MVNYKDIVGVLIVCLITEPCSSERINKCRSEDEPIVTVSEGKLRGVKGTLLDGSSYYSFKGIPYAQAPTGQKRFQAPLPTKPWEGVRDAIDHGLIYTQDYLFVNVYSKSLSHHAKIPVMVFIHGGSYSFNSGNSETYSPDLLLRHDVILVTMNYRLGFLGNLCLDTPEVPGNAGMKDQVAALRWVKKNIANFGGNPDNITIFGESSGASSVTSHMLSPSSKGLFHKVIAQSGTCIHDWAIDRNAKERAFQTGKLLGIDTNDTDKLLEYLRGLKPTFLPYYSQKTMKYHKTYRGIPDDYFKPVVEKKFEGVEAFMDEEPINTLVNGKVSDVPLMIGYNSAEDLVLLNYLIEKLEVYNNDPSYFGTKELAENLNEEILKDYGDRIREFYVNGRNLTKHDPEIIEKIGSDIHFLYNTHRFAHLYSLSCQPIYMYRFNYDTDLNVIKNFTGHAHLKGAAHADELFYLFYNSLNKKPHDEQERLRELALKVTTLWTNFAKTGNPTPDESLGVEWLPYTTDGKEYINLEDNMTMGRYADRDRMNFWNDLYKEAGVPYITSD